MEGAAHAGGRPRRWRSGCPRYSEAAKAQRAAQVDGAHGRKNVERVVVVVVLVV